MTSEFSGRPLLILDRLNTVCCVCFKTIVSGRDTSKAHGIFCTRLKEKKPPFIGRFHSYFPSWNRIYRDSPLTGAARRAPQNATAETRLCVRGNRRKSFRSESETRRGVYASRRRCLPVLFPRCFSSWCKSPAVSAEALIVFGPAEPPRIRRSVDGKRANGVLGDGQSHIREIVCHLPPHAAFRPRHNVFSRAFFLAATRRPPSTVTAVDLPAAKSVRRHNFTTVLLPRRPFRNLSLRSPRPVYDVKSTDIVVPDCVRKSN